MSDTTARTPEEIRRDIERTRTELAETAAALAERADVKARAHERIDETKARFTHRVEETRSKVTGTIAGTAGAAKEKATDLTPSTVAGGAQHAAGTLTTTVRRNPVPAAMVAGVALGIAVGLVLGSRR